MCRISLRALSMLVAGLASAAASAGSLDFNGLVHGAVLSTRFVGSHGVTISAVDNGGGPNLGVTFDSTRTGTADPDLEDPRSGGNLAGNTFLGNLVIIQENSTGCADGVCDSPDDEGTRPDAGRIRFDFATAIDSIGFDLVDVEGPSEIDASAGYVAAFFLDGLQMGRVGFGDFVDPLSAYYDTSVAFGDSYANRIRPISAAQLGMSHFDAVEFSFGGSAAIDNLVWSSFEPPATCRNRPRSAWC